MSSHKPCCRLHTRNGRLPPPILYSISCATVLTSRKTNVTSIVTEVDCELSSAASARCTAFSLSAEWCAVKKQKTLRTAASNDMSAGYKIPPLRKLCEEGTIAKAQCTSKVRLAELLERILLGKFKARFVLQRQTLLNRSILIHDFDTLSAEDAQEMLFVEGAKLYLKYFQIGQPPAVFSIEQEGERHVFTETRGLFDSLGSAPNEKNTVLRPL